jgi:hypothetical protein
MFNCCTIASGPPRRNSFRGDFFKGDNVMKEEQKDPKTWISFRVKPEEYEQIYRHFKKSTCRKLSDYARKVLLHKPVMVVYRNQSTDDFLSVAGSMIKTLNGIGNNFNQAVKKLHTLKGLTEFKQWYLSWNIGRQTLFNKIDELKEVTLKFYEHGRQDKDAK